MRTGVTTDDDDPDEAVVTTGQRETPVTESRPTDNRRWFALAVIGLSQLIVVLDLTIVNVALPDAQRALGISDSSGQWVVTSYALSFGSLLLLGGRIPDYWGRKRTLIVGLLGFAVASGAGGLAQNGPELFTSRALQGTFAALLAPAALSILQVTFPSGRERARAFSVYGAVAGGGAASGSILGGVLTEYANWRWCLLVNVPVIAVCVVAASVFVAESRAHGDTRYDFPGALSVTVALAALVFGFTNAAQHGWAEAATAGFLAAGTVLLVAFVVIESRCTHPLLPLKIVTHRTRGGSLLAQVLGGSALLGTLLYLAYYMQLTLHYSPLEAGLASLPNTLVFILGTGSGFIERVMIRFGSRATMITGAIIAAGGLMILTRIDDHSPYWEIMLPGQTILGIGLLGLFIPLSSAALMDVNDHDAGAASGLLSAMQQVGGAVGIALFGAIYAAASSGYLAHHAPLGGAVAASQIHGYIVVFRCTAAAMLLAAVTIATLVRVPFPGAGASR